MQEKLHLLVRQMILLVKCHHYQGTRDHTVQPYLLLLLEVTKRPTTGFGLYFDPTTGSQVLNPSTSSERVLHGPTNLKSASPTNIEFKPRGLKWNGKDAVSTSQLEQMRANKKFKSSSSKK